VRRNKKLVREVTSVTHNHQESLKTAEAVATRIYLDRRDKNKEVIKTSIMQHYYSLKFSVDAIRPFYSFDVTSQGTTLQVLECFLKLLLMKKRLEMPFH
jgi:type I restriction enzyme M protein